MLPRNYSRVYLGALMWRSLPERIPQVFYRVCLLKTSPGKNRIERAFKSPFLLIKIRIFDII